jgi:hypothetical protein
MLMTKRSPHAEEGWALVTAVVLMTIMLGLGLAAYSMSDNQQKLSGVERAREAQLNLTEGVLSAQIFALSRNWPAAAAGAYPTSCTQGSANPDQCPQAARVRSHFDAVDFRPGSAWTVQVRDNGGTYRSYYTDAVLAGQPAWDADGDGQVWVRAQGTIKNKTRVLVARVKVESLPVRFPNAPFVAGSMGTSNSGGHGGRVLVDTAGSPGIVRCVNPTPAAAPNRGNPCAGYDADQINGTVLSQPDTPTNVITPEVLDALRQTAKANGTYSAGCPANPVGKVVFVESGNCEYRVNGSVNSQANPGIFIVNSGTMFCNGNTSWYGIMYLVNAQNSSGVVFDNKGGCTVYGGIFIDGPGRLEIGSNAPNLVYDPTLVFNATAYGTAGIVQNTWREFQPGS